ncbi:MAG: recombination protein O N-terminal domain-containing protein, partial [bacterium]|nr:recombination protein O N-terminal domain-containing protein [bacterium]
VLSRAPAGETNALVTLLTQNVGLVRARAQGIRRSGAKLAAALATFAESDLVLVRGRESWRIAGAVLEENWFARMRGNTSTRAARVSGLLLQLVAGEVYDSKLFSIVSDFFKALTELPEEKHDAVEVLTVLRVLATLGLDTGDVPNGASAFAPELLTATVKNRASYITRINHGITASGL